MFNISGRNQKVHYELTLKNKAKAIPKEHLTDQNEINLYLQTARIIPEVFKRL